MMFWRGMEHEVLANYHTKCNITIRWWLNPTAKGSSPLWFLMQIKQLWLSSTLEVQVSALRHSSSNPSRKTSGFLCGLLLLGTLVLAGLVISTEGFHLSADVSAFTKAKPKFNTQLVFLAFFYCPLNLVQMMEHCTIGPSLGFFQGPASSRHPAVTAWSSSQSAVGFLLQLTNPLWFHHRGFLQGYLLPETISQNS